jgi:hypothetical protein
MRNAIVSSDDIRNRCYQKAGVDIVPIELYSSEAFILGAASRDIVPAHLIEELATQDQRDISLRWLALQVRAKAERYLANLLVRKGYECFLPLNSQNDDSPLFPAFREIRDAVSCLNARESLRCCISYLTHENSWRIV